MVVRCILVYKAVVSLKEETAYGLSVHGLTTFSFPIFPRGFTVPPIVYCSRSCAAQSTVKLSPHPHSALTFGLLNTNDSPNPCFWKCMVVP